MGYYFANQFRQLKAASRGEESLSLFTQSKLQFTKYLQTTGFQFIQTLWRCQLAITLSNRWLKGFPTVTEKISAKICTRGTNNSK